MASTVHKLAIPMVLCAAICGAAASFGAGDAGDPAAEQRPNILLIVGDDHGWPYAGFMGDRVARTPHLDELARQGTLFTNVHNTASVCRPAMLAFLSGVTAQRWKAKRARLVAALGRIRLREEIVHYRTLPKELARVGYRSWQGGKHWEGTYAQAGFTDGTARERFKQHDDSDDGWGFGRDGREDGRALEPFTEFLDAVGERPFFAMAAPMLPHLPYVGDAELRAQFEAESRDSLTVGYYANLAVLDSLVGAMLAEIDRRGLRDRTLVIYVSDNGWRIGDDAVIFSQRGRGKLSLYELGFRTPMILRWPGRIAPGDRRDDLVSTLDLFPTILDYAGAPQVPGRRGTSLRPLIEGRESWTREKIVMRQQGAHDYSSGYVVRTRNWRYIGVDDGTEQLYRIDADPFEENDLAAQHPKLLAKFREDVEGWKREIAESPLPCSACEQRARATP